MKKILSVLVLGMFISGLYVNSAFAATQGKTNTPNIQKEGLKNGQVNGQKEGLKYGKKNGMKYGLKKGLKNGLKNGELKTK